MNKEDILAAGRKEKKGKEYENKVTVKSSLYGELAALIVCGILFFSEYFIRGSVNTSIMAVVWAAIGVQSLVEGIKNRPFKVHLILIGVVASLFALLITVSCIKGMVATA